MRAAPLRRWIALSCLLAAWGCGRDATRPSILLLSIDTLRADHLGSYGYERDTSPHLDAFAARAVRFERAWAPAPWTLPSHVALLSGRHPYEVGIADQRSAIPEDVTLLAERLAGAGYRTAAFVDSGPGGFVGARRGFDRGFETYRHAPHGPSPWRYDMATTVDAGLSWIDALAGEEPFFLFLHTKSVHTAPVSVGGDAPYDKPEPWRSHFLPASELRFDWRGDLERGGVHYLRHLNQRIADGELDPASVPGERLAELVALYDGGIRYVDHHFRRLLDGLAARDLDDRVVVVVTADHGEAFLDHRLFLHKEVHGALLHVPLIVHDPRAAAGGRVVGEPVTLMDVAPTLLSLAGRPLDGSGGRALLGDAPSPPAIGAPLFGYYRLDDDAVYEGYALYDGRYRLVHDKLRHEPGFRTALFDTEADPREQRPLEAEAERREAMLAALQRRLAEEGRAGRRIDLDKETREQLRALGYLD